MYTIENPFLCVSFSGWRLRRVFLKVNTKKVLFILPLPFLRLCLNLEWNVVGAYSVYIRYIHIYMLSYMMICIHASWCDDNDNNLFLIHCTYTSDRATTQTSSIKVLVQENKLIIIWLLFVALNTHSADPLSSSASGTTGDLINLHF